MSTVFWPVYHVTCLKGPLKRDFLDICLTTSFKVGKFENTSAMRLIVFLKMFKVQSKFKKWKKNYKTFLVSEIIASENVGKNCLY